MTQVFFRATQLAVAASLVFASSAFAQTAAPAPAASPVTFNISLTSNYKYRGQDQDLSRTSQFKPALQGGFDFAHSSGFYIGNWNSTVNFLEVTTFPTVPNKANLEIDLYGGYKFSLGDVGMDVGALTYIYPSAGRANTTELYLAASVGPVTAKYSTTVSKDYFSYGAGVNNARGTGYLNIAFAKEVAPNFTLKASVGSTMFSGAIRNSGVSNFVDYSIGGTYDFGDGLSLTGALQGASNKDKFNYAVGTSVRSANRDTLLFTLTKAL